MGNSLLWVVYEDRLADGAKDYALHDLVLACVNDDLDDAAVSLWGMRKQVRPNPKKGNSNVLKECSARYDKLVGISGAMIAVFDNDRICECAKVANDSCRTTVLEALRGIAFPENPKHGARLDIVLIEENTESIIAAIQQCAPELVSSAVFESALDKADRSDRDRVLNAAAHGLESRAVRDQLRTSTSFERLVSRVRMRYREILAT